MAIVNSISGYEGIVAPFISLGYYMNNRFEVKEYSAGNLYEADDYFSGVLLSKHTEITASKCPYKPDGGTFKVGQYVNTPYDIIIPKTASHDLLTDIVAGMYQAIIDDQPEIAYVFYQSYMLVNKLILTRAPYIGGAPDKYGVKPYAI